MDLKAFNTIEQCEDALLNEFTHIISEGIEQNKSVTIALAGGNTPKGLYQKLGKVSLDWSNIKVTLTDERWVDIHHEDSNEKMLTDTLFQHHAKAAKFIPLKNTQASAQQGQMDAEQLLKQNSPTLDYVLLGMGDDGHFASIFPGMSNTDELLDFNQKACCLPATPEGKPPRMSLTLRYLLSAQHIYIFIKGDAKRQLIEEQSFSDTAQRLPIYYLLTQTLCPVTVYWSES